METNQPKPATPEDAERINAARGWTWEQIRARLAELGADSDRATRLYTTLDKLGRDLRQLAQGAGDDRPLTAQAIARADQAQADLRDTLEALALTAMQQAAFCVSLQTRLAELAGEVRLNRSQLLALREALETLELTNKAAATEFPGKAARADRPPG